MSQTGIFIAGADFQEWPENLKSQVLEQILGGAHRIEGADQLDRSGAVEHDEDYDEHFAELSPGQVRDFLSGCSSKTKTALRAMVQGESRFFQLKDVAAEVGVPASKLTGVWSGLTRRTKTVTGDSEAYLIDWSGGEAIWEREEYVDHRGELTEMTRASFRKVLGVG